MEYFLTEEQLMLQELSAKIADEKIAPIANQYDEEEKFPHDIIKLLVDSDLWGMYIPEKYGGLGSSLLDFAIVNEQLSRGCGGIAMAFGGTLLGSFPIVLYGTEEQKARILPGIIKGKIGAFALTEANAGSDAAAVATTAVLDGDEYVINGTKQWISNGGEADFYTVIARYGQEKGTRGLSAFIVEKDTKGFTYGKKENKMGMRASATRELIFTDCRIPKENMLGNPGEGFKAAMRTLDRTRTAAVGASSVGMAQRAFEEALKYSRQRIQFGQPVFNFQAVQHMLADMAIQIEAARCLVYQTCRHVDSGAPYLARESAMAKVFTTDMLMKVTTDAVQVMGGYGYMKEYPVEKIMRDAKVTQIFEGTNQIQRNIIARELQREMDKK